MLKYFNNLILVILFENTFSLTIKKIICFTKIQIKYIQLLNYLVFKLLIQLYIIQNSLFLSILVIKDFHTNLLWMFLIKKYLKINKLRSMLFEYFISKLQVNCNDYIFQKHFFPTLKKMIEKPIYFCHMLDDKFWFRILFKAKIKHVYIMWYFLSCKKV